MAIKLKYNYLAFFVVLFLTEVVIALYVHDDFIRPFFGDVLVVILIYCFLMSFLKVSKIKMAVFVLLFAFGIELGQYCDLISILHLQNSRLARVVIGTSYSTADLGCYLVGFVLILLVEYWLENKKNNKV